MTKTTTRVGASIAALALATGAALATAAPASAATTVGSTTWYGPTDFGVESGGYPATPWFFGDVATDGVHGFTAAGLNATVDAGEAVQILNPNVFTPATAGALVSLVETSMVYASNGDWNFQLPFFAEPGETIQEFTTLRLDSLGTQPTGAATWVTSQAFGTYAAGDTDTLTNFATALYGGVVAPELLAYGVIVGGSTGTAANVDIAAISWDGALSAFTPVVSRTVTPNPVTPAQATTTGIRFQGAGWIPGSEVYIQIAVCDPIDETEPLYFDSSGVAAADGTVDVTVVLPTAPAVGTYCVYFDDDGVFFAYDAMDEFELTVANVLPATGLEITAPVVGGIAFLVIGGLALAVTRKVERNTNA